ncbi:MAG: aminotransferase class V-fold PLP-dependent enzyme, partial [Variibacter sp.]|nr:aminotransferase class V-fold PLP-dependent enzyme [Variibacter sp.]
PPPRPPPGPAPPRRPRPPPPPPPRDCLLVSAIEHPSVRAGGRFAPDAVLTVQVTAAGVVDLADLERRLAQQARRGRVRPLVSIMAANNETGVLQPIREAAAIVHAAGGLLHVDAVQATGRIEININALDADLVTVSSHKIGGPQGAGALILRDESLQIADPVLKGGGQERGLRAGTENVAAIAGFGAAAAEVAQQLPAERERMAKLRDRLEDGLRAIAPDTVIFGAAADRLPNTTLFAVAGIKAETALIALDLEGIAVSSGAACSSGKVGPSHVLAAMGVAPGLARGAIRTSIGHGTTPEEIERFLQAWRKCLGVLLRSRGAIAA